MIQNRVRAAIAVFVCWGVFTLAAPQAQAIPPQSASAAIRHLIQQTDSPLPTGTRLLGVNIAKGLATVNFSREFKANFRGGDSEELNAINSILQTLGTFPTITRTQILVQNAPIESLGGLVIISDSLNVIRPSTLVKHLLYAHRRMKN